MSIYEELEARYEYYVPRSKYIYDILGIHKVPKKAKRNIYDYLFLYCKKL